MNAEIWDYKYVTLVYDGNKYTMTILHYKSGEPEDRAWFRVMSPEFDVKKPASSQMFGFGYDLESAIKRFFHSIDFVRNGLAVQPMKGLNDHRRA